MDILTFYVLTVLFSATLVRSTLGFGESLVAVPLLLFCIPIEVTVPLSVLMSVFIAFIVLLQDRDQVHFHSAKWLILFAVAGIPVGLALLVYGNERIVKAVLALLIMLYSIYCLISKSSFTLKNDHKAWLFICGFLSGVFGGAYGANGPPLVIYGNMRNWSPKHFRATLQAYFLPVSTIGMLAYWYEGLWTREVTRYFIISIPAIIPAVFLGRYLNGRLAAGVFLKYVYVGLLLISILLLYQSVT